MACRLDLAKSQLIGIIVIALLFLFFMIFFLDCGQNVAIKKNAIKQRPSAIKSYLLKNGDWLCKHYPDAKKSECGICDEAFTEYMEEFVRNYKWPGKIIKIIPIKYYPFIGKECIKFFMIFYEDDK